MENQILYSSWRSPCGELIIATIDGELVMSDWKQGWHHETILNRFKRLTGLPWVKGENGVIEKTISELKEYFDGQRRQFDLPLRMIGSAFQIKVWNALLQIPYGEQCSYADVAHAIHNPKAVRAVGGAVGQNPFSIIIPCHRVVGANRSLTGYGGGYEAKKFLLRLENPQAELFSN